MGATVLLMFASVCKGTGSRGVLFPGSPAHKEFTDQCLSSSLPHKREGSGKKDRKTLMNAAILQEWWEEFFALFSTTDCIFNLLSYRLAFTSALKMASGWGTYLSEER